MSEKKTLYYLSYFWGELNFVNNWRVTEDYVIIMGYAFQWNELSQLKVQLLATTISYGFVPTSERLIP